MQLQRRAPAVDGPLLPSRVVVGIRADATAAELAGLRELITALGLVPRRRVPAMPAVIYEVAASRRAAAIALLSTLPAVRCVAPCHRQDTAAVRARVISAPRRLARRGRVIPGIWPAGRCRPRWRP